MKVFESPYLYIYLDEAQSYIEIVWTKKTTNLSSDEFKEILEQYRDTVLRAYKPHNVLHDMRNFYFVIHIEMQKWIDDNINKPAAFECEVKRVGFLVPPEFLTQIAVEQTMEESPQLFHVGYFDSLEEARAWAKRP